MEVTLETLGDALMKIVADKVKFTSNNAVKIGDRIGADLSANIVAGQALPELMESTIKSKKAKGYSQPETPLYATGDYAANFKGEFVADDEMWIVNKSRVSPQWQRIKERSLSVINQDNVKTILQEELIK